MSRWLHIQTSLPPIPAFGCLPAVASALQGRLSGAEHAPEGCVPSDPPRAGEMTVIDAQMSSREANCRLRQLFGEASSSAFPTVQFRAQSFELTTDIEIGPGTSAKWIGETTDVMMGRHQIRVASTASLEVKGISFSRSAGGSAIVVHGQLRVEGGSFSECRASLNLLTDEGLQSAGGAILALAGSAVSLRGTSLTRCSVEGGEHSSLGGAICGLSGASVRMFYGVVEGNVARSGAVRSYGGAVYIHGGSMLEAQGTSFRSNVAQGGGEWSAGGALYAREHSQIVMAGGDVSSNVARGGVMYNSGGGVLVHSSSELNATGVSFNANLAEGGEHSSECAGISGWLSSVIRLLESEVVNNAARGSDYASLGGGLCVQSGSELRARMTNISGNVAEDAGETVGGGAMYATGESNIHLDSSNVFGNLVQRGGYYAYGGAVGLSYGSTLHAVDTRFVSNRAESASTGCEGGAIAAYDEGSAVQLVRGEIRNNSVGVTEADSLGGGVFLLQRALMNATGTAFTANFAERADRTAQGGAVYCGDASSMVLTWCTVEANIADGGTMEAYGGAISSASAAEMQQLVQTEFRANEARSTVQSALGGAVFVRSNHPAPHMVECRFIENVARVTQFGFYARGGAVHLSPLVRARICRCVFEGNRAGGSCKFAEGGAIFAAAEMLDVDGDAACAFVGNEVSTSAVEGVARGGAIMQQGASSRVSACFFEQNRALVTERATQASGGAISLALGTQLHALDSSFDGNTAENDLSESDGALWVQAGILRQSSARHIFSNGALVLERCTMSDKIAPPVLPVTAMWWIVVAGKRTIELEASRVSATKEHVMEAFDPCEWSGDGSCDTPEWCDDGDWDDCEVPRPIVPLREPPGRMFLCEGYIVAGARQLQLMVEGWG